LIITASNYHIEMANLQDFPNEVLLNIIKFMNLADIFSLRKSNINRRIQSTTLHFCVKQFGIHVFDNNTRDIRTLLKAGSKNLSIDTNGELTNMRVRRNTKLKKLTMNLCLKA
jgi:hypothetical protein